MKKLFVIGMAALLLVAFTMPAMAKVKIGGIIFTSLYYLDRDSDNKRVYNPAAFGNDSYTNTRIDLNPISRFYFRWTNEDNVGLYFESSVSSSDVGIRHFYGWWEVNPMFQIMAGHSTTPFSPLAPSQLIGLLGGSTNVIGLGYGEFYAGRFQQVRGTFRFGKAARLEIAIVDPNGSASLGMGEFGPWAVSENNTKIPRIDIGVPIYAGPVHIYPSFLYQHRTVDLPAGHTEDNDLDTFVGSLGLKAGFGPFGIAMEGNWGENWANTRGQFGSSPSARLAAAVLKNNNQIHDAETYSFWIDLSYKFGPVTPHIIYGQQKSENENAAGSEMECKTQMWGVSVPIDLARGFRVRPEVMWYDDGDTSTEGSSPSVDNGKYAIYGVQFQITF